MELERLDVETNQRRYRINYDRIFQVVILLFSVTSLGLLIGMAVKMNSFNDTLNEAKALIGSLKNVGFDVRYMKEKVDGYGDLLNGSLSYIVDKVDDYGVQINDIQMNVRGYGVQINSTIKAVFKLFGQQPPLLFKN